MDQYTRGKCLIHGTKYRKDNQSPKPGTPLYNNLVGNVNMKKGVRG